MDKSLSLLFYSRDRKRERKERKKTRKNTEGRTERSALNNKEHLEIDDLPKESRELKDEKKETREKKKTMKTNQRSQESSYFVVWLFPPLKSAEPRPKRGPGGGGLQGRAIKG